MNVQVAEIYGRVGLCEAKKKNYDDALRLLNIATIHGDITALTNLGFAYESLKDYKKANFYYEQALLNKEACGIVNLAKDYQFGRGVKKNYAKALELYLKAIALGDTDSYELIAEMYSVGGYGLKKDGDMSFQYASKGKDIAPSSMYALGECYKRGLGVKKDYKMAVKCYEESLRKKPSIYVYNDLADIYRDHFHDKEKALINYINAAEKGNIYGIRNIGVMNYDLYKENNNKDNLETALFFFRLAALKEDVYSEYSLFNLCFEENAKEYVKDIKGEEIIKYLKDCMKENPDKEEMDILHKSIGKCNDEKLKETLLNIISENKSE